MFLNVTLCFVHVQRTFNSSSHNVWRIECIYNHGKNVSKTFNKLDVLKVQRTFRNKCSYRLTLREMCVSLFVCDCRKIYIVFLYKVTSTNNLSFPLIHVNWNSDSELHQETEMEKPGLNEPKHWFIIPGCINIINNTFSHSSPSGPLHHSLLINSLLDASLFAAETETSDWNSLCCSRVNQQFFSCKLTEQIKFTNTHSYTVY